MEEVSNYLYSSKISLFRLDMLTHADIIWFLVSLLLWFDLKSSFSKTKTVLKGGELPVTLKSGQRLTKMLPGSITPTGAVVL